MTEKIQRNSLNASEGQLLQQTMKDEREKREESGARKIMGGD